MEVDSMKKYTISFGTYTGSTTHNGKPEKGQEVTVRTSSIAYAYKRYLREVGEIERCTGHSFFLVDGKPLTEVQAASL